MVGSERLPLASNRRPIASCGATSASGIGIFLFPLLVALLFLSLPERTSDRSRMAETRPLLGRRLGAQPEGAVPPQGRDVPDKISEFAKEE